MLRSVFFLFFSLIKQIKKVEYWHMPYGSYKLISTSSGWFLYKDGWLFYSRRDPILRRKMKIAPNTGIEIPSKGWEYSVPSGNHKIRITYISLSLIISIVLQALDFIGLRILCSRLWNSLQHILQLSPSASSSWCSSLQSCGSSTSSSTGRKTYWSTCVKLEIAFFYFFGV